MKPFFIIFLILTTFKAEAYTKLQEEFLRLFADAIISQAPLMEKKLIQSIQENRNDPENYVLYSRFIFWQVQTGQQRHFALTKVSNFADYIQNLDPKRPVSELLKCEIYDILAQKEEARECYLKALQKDPKHKDILEYEARTFAQDNPQRAIDTAYQALLKGSSLDLLSASIIQAGQQYSPKSYEFLEKFAEHYPDRWLYHHLGMAYLKEGFTSQAEKAFLKAIELKNPIDSLIQYAILQGTLRNKPQEAFHLLENAQKKLEELHMKDHIIYDHIEIQKLRMILEFSSYKEKETYFKKFLQFKHYDESLPLIYSILLHKNQHEEIKIFLKDALYKNPFSEEGYALYFNYFQNQEDKSDLIQTLQKAIQLRPTAKHYALRGLVAHQTQNYEEAISYYNISLQKNPHDANTLYNKACSLAQQGKNQEAIQNLEFALRLDSTLKNLILQDFDLIPLRNSPEFAIFEQKQNEEGIGAQLPEN